MHVFVTGASGFIGSATVSELLRHGHTVTGLARSEESAAKVKDFGAGVLVGSLGDVDILQRGAAQADGVIHLAYVHDFANIAASPGIDRVAIEALGTPLRGTGKPLVIASGVGLLPQGRVTTERDTVDPASPVRARADNEEFALGLAQHDVRSSSVRFAPTVHGVGDKGFIPMLMAHAREVGVARYVGDGSNHWPAVHRLDAAKLCRLAVESAPGGTVLHAVAEQGIPTRAISEAFGRALGVPVGAMTSEQAAAELGFLGHFWGADVQASSEATRELLGWTPTHIGLIEDIDAGHYTAAAN